jgi:threonine aldolase
VQLPSPPQRSFASDNASGAHPDVIAAIIAANHGHALAYGDDEWTRACEARFADLFGQPVATLLTFTGTGGNVLGLSTLLRPVDAVVCAGGSHVNADEAGAMERIAGAKLIDLDAPDGKLVPEQLRDLAPMLGNEHHAQPAVVSITQSTELGTVYSAAEVAALCETAHSMDMKVHMDGARIANAAAALGCTVAALRSFTIDAGVDVLTFGGTKNGLLGGEAVVFLDPALAARARYVRKMVTQLPSKMRFVAAQFNALLDGELWLRNARHSNAMATLLYDAVTDLDAVDVAKPQVNGLFPTLPADAIAPLQAWSFFWDWDVANRQVRWMTSWDTTADDVERFAAGVATAVSSADVTSGTPVGN